ncbi:hypothetical protein FDECE_12630 [Fusarium decemcellulare]|nr:hypothetical protein FDECE_12630 [Fusarium decemcellulare]
MASDTFHRFPDFPPEIQALIWDAAVRPSSAWRLGHVQRFIMTDHYFKQANPRYRVSGKFLKLSIEGRPSSGYSLAVPDDDPYGGPNDSIYATDSGLWSACKESRAAVERQFIRNEWWSDIECDNHPKILATRGQHFPRFDATHTASYKDNDKQVRHITITHRWDLFYLDPRNMTLVDWWHHYAGDHAPLIDYRNDQDPEIKCSFFGQNIALDYDPTMLDVLLDRRTHFRRKDLGISSTSLIDMIEVFYEKACRTMWFIDHRLKPVSGNSTIAAKAIEGRNVWYSDDTVFIEVKREDMGTRWILEPDADDASEGKNESVFDFVDSMFQMPPYRLEDDGSDRLKVLACQARPGRTLRPWLPFSNPCLGPDCEMCGFPGRIVRKPRVVTDEERAADMEENEILLNEFNLFGNE